MPKSVARFKNLFLNLFSVVLVVCSQVVLAAEEDKAPAAITVMSVVFEGDGHMLSDELQGQLRQPILGADLRDVELKAFTQSIRTALQEQGYVTSLVGIPAEDISAGNLIVNVTIGRLDTPAFVLNPQSAVASSTVATIKRILVQRLPAGSVLRKAQLESSLLLVNRLAGVSASSKMVAGAKSGTTQLIIDVAEQAGNSASLEITNTGNNTTGLEVANVQWQRNNPFAQNGRLDFNLTKSAGVTSLSAKRHFAPDAKAGNWHYALTNVQYASITSDPTTSGLHGRSIALDVGKKWYLEELLGTTRTLDVSLHTSSVYDANELGGVNMVLGDKNVQTLQANYSAQVAGLVFGKGNTSYSSLLTLGNIDLPTDANVVQNYAVDQTPGGGAYTDGQYATLVVDVNHTQPLTPTLDFSLQAKGQLASKNLDGSAKFSLGGPDGVRAYPVGEASSDEGAFSRLELRWAPMDLAKYHNPKFTAFYDAGYARLYNDPNVGGGISINTDQRKNEYNLEGYGVSIAGRPNAKLQWNLTYAHKMGTNGGRDFLQNDSDGQQSKNRWWFSLSNRF